MTSYDLEICVCREGGIKSMCVDYIPGYCIESSDCDAIRFGMRDSEDNIDLG